jgi:hypothetical protein
MIAVLIYVPTLFLVGFVDSFTRDTIMDISQTSAHYFFSFFVVDLVASIPTEAISLMSTEDLSDVRVIKAFRMIKVRAPVVVLCMHDA